MNKVENTSTIEVALVILTGVGHVTLEVASDGLKGAADTLNRPQHIYNLVAVCLWGAYLAWRFLKTPSIARAWGFTSDGFGAAIKSCGVFGVIALVPLLGYGAQMGRLPLPRTFWLVLALYPLWGLAQQFALQALITRNLRNLVPKLPFRVVAATVLFSASHFPNYWLMALTFVAGVVFTWIYERHGNLWAVGITHGVLGALAYYIVLGHDPGAQIIGWLKHAGI